MSAVSTNDKATVLTLKKRLSEPDRDLMAIIDSLSSINMDKQLLKETMIGSVKALPLYGASIEGGCFCVLHSTLTLVIRQYYQETIVSS